MNASEQPDKLSIKDIVLIAAVTTMLFFGEILLYLFITGAFKD